MSAPRTDTFDLGPLRLRAGEARHLDLEVGLDHFELSNERYDVQPTPIPIQLDATRMTGGGWSLRLRLSASLNGPCMRCLEPASPTFSVDAYEVDQPGDGPELDSPYVDNEVVDIAGWTRDALALELPANILCTPQCLGLCPDCGTNLNTAGPDHHHEKGPDSRWAALSQIKFEE
ncbi:YceD family protein [Baekduia sp. Peel2402]|uniref:YceD family protein n=1 Tax=Baekduia sp. Peel2402 TaxID=3458296 RepID=UPI00403E8A93